MSGTEAKRLLIGLGALLALCLSACGQDLDRLSSLDNARNFRFSSSSIDPSANVDFRPILPGQTYTLAEIEGPGIIRRIWMTILPSEPGYSRLMTIRIYWDGEKNPSVECPIGDFFGDGRGGELPAGTRLSGR